MDETQDGVEWGDIGMELTNKIRWAIGSTLSSSPIVALPYRSQMALAALLASDTVQLMKAKHHKPDLEISRKTIRKLLTVR